MQNSNTSRWINNSHAPITTNIRHILANNPAGKDPVGPQLSFGYVLAPAWWGQGYATEAAGALLRFGFEDLGAHRLFAHVFVGNEASARVLTKLGLRLESEVKQGTFVRGQWHDVRTYAMLRNEFVKRHT